MTDYTEENVTRGTLLVEVRGPDGALKHMQTVRNLITDVGDAYYAAKAIVGIAPAAPSAPTAVTGMKLGTGATAASKAGAGAALVSYITGSNQPFDSGYPTVSNLGSGLGVNAVYRAFWDAGEATQTGIQEVVIVNDSATDATSSAANTVARAVLTSFDKGAADTLTITWNHKNLGA